MMVFGCVKHKIRVIKTNGIDVLVNVFRKICAVFCDNERDFVQCYQWFVSIEELESRPNLRKNQ